MRLIVIPRKVNVYVLVNFFISVNFCFSFPMCKASNIFLMQIKLIFTRKKKKLTTTFIWVGGISGYLYSGVRITLVLASCLTELIISLTHAVASSLQIHPKSGVPKSPHLLLQSILVIIMGSTYMGQHLSGQSLSWKWQVQKTGHRPQVQVTVLSISNNSDNLHFWPDLWSGFCNCRHVGIKCDSRSLSLLLLWK